MIIFFRKDIEKNKYELTNKSYILKFIPKIFEDFT